LAIAGGEPRRQSAEARFLQARSACPELAFQAGGIFLGL